MRIRDWPDEERPRERLLARGARNLSDAELLALFLGSGVRGEDAVTTARVLLNAHGPLGALLDRPAAELARLRGIGTARACLLAGAIELGDRRVATVIQRGESMAGPGAAAKYFARHLRPQGTEVFAAMFLDTRHRRIAFEELFQGTIDSAEVYPREVARRALVHNAACVIVGHNHPSGVAKPSAADLLVTRCLKESLALLDIRLLDHIIIGDGPPVSLAARGQL